MLNFLFQGIQQLAKFKSSSQAINASNLKIQGIQQLNNRLIGTQRSKPIVDLNNRNLVKSYLQESSNGLIPVNSGKRNSFLPPMHNVKTQQKNIKGMSRNNEYTPDQFTDFASPRDIRSHMGSPKYSIGYGTPSYAELLGILNSNQLSAFISLHIQ